MDKIAFLHKYINYPSEKEYGYNNIWENIRRCRLFPLC